MKCKLFILLIAILMLASCEKETDNNPTTKATITVLDNSNEAADGISVYAYTEDKWLMIGDDPLFADKTVSTENNGEAIFLIDDIDMIFHMETQENIHFSVHYNLNGLDKTKTTSLTFIKGDQKTKTITLN